MEGRWKKMRFESSEGGKGCLLYLPLRGARPSGKRGGLALLAPTNIRTSHPTPSIHQPDGLTSSPPPPFSKPFCWPIVWPQLGSLHPSHGRTSRQTLPSLYGITRLLSWRRSRGCALPSLGVFLPLGYCVRREVFRPATGIMLRGRKQSCPSEITSAPYNNSKDSMRPTDREVLEIMRYASPMTLSWVATHATAPPVQTLLSTYIGGWRVNTAQYGVVTVQCQDISLPLRLVNFPLIGCEFCVYCTELRNCRNHQTLRIKIVNNFQSHSKERRIKLLYMYILSLCAK